MKLFRYLTGRAGHSLLVLLCVSFLAIGLVKCTPGDYFDSARVDPRISPSALSAMRSEQGLDRALPILYWRWLASVGKGQWGYSFAYNAPAFPILFPRALNTLLLTAISTAFAWIVALLLGIASGIAPRGTIARLTTVLTAVLLAIPELVLALATLLISARMNLLRMSLSTEAGHLVSRLLVPALCLSVGLLPLLVSHVRTSVRQTSEMPFVTAARNWGISDVRLVWRWIVPASLNPIISLGGVSIGILMSSSFIVEGVFGWPGLGLLMLQAIHDRDIFLIVDAAIVGAGFLVMGDLFADALLYLSDPRIRTD